MKDFTMFVCLGLTAMFVGIIAFWVGISAVYTQNGIQGFVCLILWTLAIKLLNAASDRYNGGSHQ